MFELSPVFADQRSVRSFFLSQQGTRTDQVNPCTSDGQNKLQVSQRSFPFESDGMQQPRLTAWLSLEFKEAFSLFDKGASRLHTPTEHSDLGDDLETLLSSFVAPRHRLFLDVLRISQFLLTFFLLSMPGSMTAQLITIIPIPYCARNE